MATANAAIAIDNSITLDWADVAGANLYKVQVSLFADFRAVFEENLLLATSAHSFTDAEANDAKRFWRWAYSEDGGTTWSKWSEVGSYWVNTALATEYVPAAGVWALVKPSDPSDATAFELSPKNKIIPVSYNRVKDRNRQGTLLSEYLTTKGDIRLDFPENGYMHHEMFREIQRFHTEVKTFFLVASTNNGRDQVTRIWKVQIKTDPDLTMLAAGREDLMTGSIELEEV